MVSGRIETDVTDPCLGVTDRIAEETRRLP
jgi:hypothetical protein